MRRCHQAGSQLRCGCRKEDAATRFVTPTRFGIDQVAHTNRAHHFAVDRAETACRSCTFNGAIHAQNFNSQSRCAAATFGDPFPKSSTLRDGIEPDSPKMDPTSGLSRNFEFPSIRKGYITGDGHECGASESASAESVYTQHVSRFAATLSVSAILETRSCVPPR